MADLGSMASPDADEGVSAVRPKSAVAATADGEAPAAQTEASTEPKTRQQRTPWPRRLPRQPKVQQNRQSQQQKVQDKRQQPSQSQSQPQPQQPSQSEPSQQQQQQHEQEQERPHNGGSVSQGHSGNPRARNQNGHSNAVRTNGNVPEDVGATRELRAKLIEKFGRQGLNAFNSYLRNRLKLARFKTTSEFLNRCDALSIIPVQYRLSKSEVQNTVYIRRLLERFSYQLMKAELRQSQKRCSEIERLLESRVDALKELYGEELFVEIVSLVDKVHKRRYDEFLKSRSETYQSLIEEYEITAKEAAEAEATAERNEEARRQRRANVEQRRRQPSSSETNVSESAPNEPRRSQRRPLRSHRPLRNYIRRSEPISNDEKS